MNNSKKLAGIITSLIAVAIVAVIALVLSSLLSEKKVIKLTDARGEAFAEVTWNGTELEYRANNDYENEYAFYVITEAKKIIFEKEKLDEDEIDYFIYENVSEIKTNYRSEIQSALKNAYDKNPEIETADCAMAVTDLNGRLIAVFSSSEEENLSLNKTYAASTIKPVTVYAPAIESGKYKWSDMVIDAPYKKIAYPDGTVSDWPSNSNGEYTYEGVTLCDALAFSTNTVAVQILKDVGVRESLKLMKSYGINVTHEEKLYKEYGEDEILGNVALGYVDAGVSVVDMAGCYQPYANGGRYTAPTSVDEILYNSGSGYKAEYEAQRVLSQETSFIMNKLLQKVASIGTGKESRLENVDIGGKTGTTSGNADNWFVGFTPEYSCAVWHSNSNNGNISSKIFFDIFENVEINLATYPGSNGVVSKMYCDKTGELKGERCIYCNKGYFLDSDNVSICNECN